MFSDLSYKEQNLIFKKNKNLISLFFAEFFVSLIRKKRISYLPHLKIEGEKNIFDALENGHGVIVVFYHTIFVENVGYEFSTKNKNKNIKSSFVYQPFSTLFWDFHCKKWRHSVVENKNLKAMLNALKNNDILWVAIDQSPNFGEPIHFFSKEILKPPLIPWLVKHSKAKVIPVIYEDDELSGYTAKALPTWQEIKGENFQKETQIIFSRFEKYMKKYPNIQYLVYGFLNTVNRIEFSFIERIHII